jgi:adenylate cyclase
LTAFAIGLVCAGVGFALWSPVRIFGAVRALDRVYYDSLYRLRPAQGVADGSIVIVAVDDASLKAVQRDLNLGWPWPRKFWGQMVTYLEQAGARAVAFDLLFDGTSVRSHPGNDDDRQMAEAIDAASIPVVLASVAEPDGTLWAVVPPIADKVVGAANVSGEAVIRTYAPVVFGRPSLALQTARRAGVTAPDWASGAEPFSLRYYGPHATRDGRPATFRYVSAADVLAAIDRPADAARFGIADGLFKDKIVFVATITAGTYDLKSTPLSQRSPGVEVHATAVQNMIARQRVEPVAAAWRMLVLLAGTFVAAAGTVLPARLPSKVIGGLAGPLLVLGVTAGLFLGDDVRWLPAGAATIAAALAAFAGLAWSYLTELRQRRLIARAFAQYVSKDVVDEMLKDPRKIALSGDRRDMTVMFSDIANFTGVSERLDVEGVAAMLNFYLEEMSRVILDQDGTLDKYIGDSIMSFWNAPTGQPDHARRACHAALEMRRREERVGPTLRELAGEPVYSRFGVNSGPMIVGNMGSSAKFNYTVLGDSVNLAARLESANKIYGTRILISQATAELVAGRFVVRKVDLIRVKGKQTPMAVFELIAEGEADAATAELVSRYERALSLYQTRQFDDAYGVLENIAKGCPADGPTATLMRRIEAFRTAPPPADWDGVFVAKEK